MTLKQNKTMSDKELAIKVCESLGLQFKDKHEYFEFKSERLNVFVMCEHIESALHLLAAEILFSDGMAGKISTCIQQQHDTNKHDHVASWFSSFDNNGTLTPQKILSLWLEMNNE